MHTVCNFRWYLRHNSCGIAVVMPIAMAHKVLVGYESVLSTIHISDDDGNDDDDNNNNAKRVRRTVIECHQQEVYYSIFCYTTMINRRFQCSWNQQHVHSPHTKDILSSRVNANQTKMFEAFLFVSVFRSLSVALYLSAFFYFILLC